MTAGGGPPPQQWQQVPKTIKVSKKAPLVAVGYCNTMQQVVVELASPISPTASNDSILLAANKALSPTGIKMVLVGWTAHSTLILTTSPTSTAASAEQYY